MVIDKKGTLTYWTREEQMRINDHDLMSSLSYIKVLVLTDCQSCSVLLFLTAQNVLYECSSILHENGSDDSLQPSL